MNVDELRKALGNRWVIDADGNFRKLRSTRCLPPDAVSQPNPEYVAPSTDAGKTPDQKRSLVCITSYRRTLCDERNLFDKHFVDALVEAGILRGDSPTEVNVRVSQEEVKEKWQERTEIYVEDPA